MNTENKLVVTSGKRQGVGKTNIELEVQTIRYKVNYKDILHNPGEYNHYFYNNHKWSVTLKIVNHYIIHL